MSLALPSPAALLVESLPEFLGDLVPLGREVPLERGQVLWAVGGPAEDVVLLLEGRLEVVHETAPGESTTLWYLSPGALVAEPPCETERHFTSVRAEVPSRVLLISIVRFRDYLKERVDLLERLLWLQVQRVRGLPWRPARRSQVTDALTGLYCHDFFRERLAIELERAQLTGSTVVLVLFDVDRLGAYNDAYGHEAGDRALITIADLLRKTSRRGDIASRCSGGFAMLLYGATVSDGWRFAESFRGGVMATGFPGAPGQAPRRVTISCGVAGYPFDGQDEAALVEAARARLAHAKEAGRNCTVGATAASP